MALNISNMIDSDYMAQNRESLAFRALTSGKTMGIIKMIPNVKNKVSLNLLSDSISVGAATCGRVAAGTTYLAQRELEVFRKQLKEDLCPETLMTTYMAESMRSAKELPFTEMLADMKTNRIASWNEKAIWDGDGSSMPGLLEQLADDENIVDASNEVASAVGAIAKVQAMIDSATSELLMHDNKVIFCSFAFFNSYASALRAANVYMLANSEYKDGGYEMIIPGTDIKLVATAGLDSLANHTVGDGEALVFTYADNLVYGSDLLDTEDFMDIWYSRDNDVVMLTAKWAIGTSYYFAEDAVIGYTLTSLS